MILYDSEIMQIEFDEKRFLSSVWFKDQQKDKGSLASTMLDMKFIKRLSDFPFILGKTQEQIETYSNEINLFADKYLKTDDLCEQLADKMTKIIHKRKK